LFPVEPNPFGRSTQVSFALGRAQPVRLTVADVAGRAVRTLLAGHAPAGKSWLTWDGRDDTGANVASGIYFFRLEAAKEVRTAKGILLR
jgi:flagellar hook assembly protein FlgD